MLGIYDWYVLGLSCRFIWQCPVGRLLQHYDAHVHTRHLDVGVGTGYFLDRATFPAPRPEITLFDLNANSLEHARRRIERYAPNVVRGDALAPNTLPQHHYGSIAVSFLLHCLPSGGGGKWRVFDHLLPNLAADGVLFGSTLLGAHPARRRQRWLMDVYNRRGIFSNQSDSEAELRSALERRFVAVHIEVRGAVALFSARTVRGV